MNMLEELEAGQPRNKLVDFDPGDTIRVEIQVVEGEKKRVQAFQGIVIQRRGSGPRETFTVRKVSGGVGVERIFPAHAPGLVGVKVIKRGKVRRAKLNYLRDRKGKAAQVKVRHTGTRTRGKKTVAPSDVPPDTQPEESAKEE